MINRQRRAERRQEEEGEKKSMGVLIRGLSEAWEGKREREREIKREKEWSGQLYWLTGS